MNPYLYYEKFEYLLSDKLDDPDNEIEESVDENKKLKINTELIDD